MIFDFEKTDDDDLLQPDICIIGSGVAGLLLAKEFIDTDTRVLVLEGGGKKDEVQSQKLYSSEVVGLEHDGIHNGRFRVYGGSSTRWGGQLMTSRKEDFDEKSYLPYSGWPISRKDIETYYPRAEAIMRVNTKTYENDLWDDFDVKPIPFDKDRFQYRFSKWASFKNRNLAKYVGPLCKSSMNVNVLLHANVTEILLNQDGSSVESVSISSYKGKRASVKAKIFIVCAGTIDTARLLLASKSTTKNGVGNDNDLVGRYFQDHISYRVARLKPKTSKIFSETFNPFYRTSTMHSCKLDLSPEMQDKLECSHVMGHVVFDYSEESGFYEFRKVLRAVQSKKNPFPTPMGAWRMLRFVDDFFRLFIGAIVIGRRFAPKNSKSYLQLEVEQVPSPDSRVMLSDKKDALGMPRVILDWKISEREKQSMRHYVEQFKVEWERLDLGEANWDIAKDLFEDGSAWLENCRDTFHQTGTTRMSKDPEQGVVDENLKVHGISNLYIASCSVFPTGGTANPTLTMMALCMRMADRLKTII